MSDNPEAQYGGALHRAHEAYAALPWTEKADPPGEEGER